MSWLPSPALRVTTLAALVPFLDLPLRGIVEVDEEQREKHKMRRSYCVCLEQRVAGICERSVEKG